MMPHHPHPSQTELEDLAAELGKQLLAKGQMLATAESCTGGWVAQCLTAIAGSSAWFDRGFITYSNAAKTELLDVSESVLAEHGAVSEATAKAMALGVLQHSHADWAMSITGIAGPSGGSVEKPVGMVCFGLASREGFSTSLTQQFSGNREAVRSLSVRFVIKALSEQMIRIA